ncbi:MAG: hypothetical protein VB876_00120 [Pirellulales bacterium]
MRTDSITASTNAGKQFGLMALMQFMTICAILFGLSALTGITASIALVLMAFALATKCGLLAILALALAIIAADLQFATAFGNSLLRQTIVVFISIALCVWFRLR